MPITGTPCGSCDALRTDLTESHARRNELWKQTLEMVEQAKRPGTPEEVAALRRLASIAQDAATQFSDWIGSASTRNATTDSMYRLARALDAAGYPYNSHRCLDWRGSVLHELNDAGFFFSEEKEAFVFDPDAEKARPYRNHGNAVGPTLKEIAAQLRAAEGERDALRADRTGMKIRAADALADEVQVLIRRNVIDVRSPAGDALLDYRDPPNTERGDRLAAAEEAKERAEREPAKSLGERGSAKARGSSARPMQPKTAPPPPRARCARRERRMGASGKRTRRCAIATSTVLDFARDVHAIVSGKVQRTGMVRASPAVVARLIAIGRSADAG
jgi:hypothetical protein